MLLLSFFFLVFPLFCLCYEQPERNEVLTWKDLPSFFRGAPHLFLTVPFFVFLSQSDIRPSVNMWISAWASFSDFSTPQIAFCSTRAFFLPPTPLFYLFVNRSKLSMLVLLPPHWCCSPSQAIHRLARNCFWFSLFLYCRWWLPSLPSLFLEWIWVIALPHVFPSSPSLISEFSLGEVYFTMLSLTTFSHVARNFFYPPTALVYLGFSPFSV